MVRVPGLSKSQQKQMQKLYAQQVVCERLTAQIADEESGEQSYKALAGTLKNAKRKGAAKKALAFGRDEAKHARGLKSMYDSVCTTKKRSGGGGAKKSGAKKGKPCQKYKAGKCKDKCKCPHGHLKNSCKCKKK